MIADASRFFEDWRLEETLATHGRTVTEADVANFAGLTGDINPLHMDAVYAASTRFGQRLPHGQLLFVLALGLAERVIAPLFHSSVVAFAGVDRLRFVRPVFIGDTIRLERRVMALEVRDADTGMLVFDDQVLKQDGSVAIAFRPRYLMKRRPASC
ncbi:MaoC/PaaZ C-terminal domain-containing protein [Humitalea sp. 24SJ18S-53]|uniref:MaoC/PaaZ C-terminal domain-containing protein n=1 Tax=Humitalea sp. 24SJ18S-53 TaxID=3422307 RepID=UPI003D671438